VTEPTDLVVPERGATPATPATTPGSPHSATSGTSASAGAGRPSRRRFLALGSAAALLALAACGDDDDADDAGAGGTEGTDGAADDGTAATSWEFVDDRGVTISLPARPERIVAYVGTAAVLWDFGIRPVGVFGPSRREDGTPEPAAGNVDLDTVESAGDTWDAVNLEVLATLRPDLVITGGVADPWVISQQLDDVAEIAPVAVVEVYGAPASTIMANYERMAEALGADLGSDELVAARADYDAAAEAVRTAAAAKPGLSVLATYADTDGLYIAQPTDFPDLAEFQVLGVEVIDPTSTEPYWELLSWERAGEYPADLIIHDIRSFSLQPDVLADDQPTWTTLPAVQAGQVGAWSAEAILSYQGFAAALRELATEIDASAADVV
jgi:iron complex transport system substrate-binding protein